MKANEKFIYDLYEKKMKNMFEVKQKRKVDPVIV